MAHGTWKPVAGIVVAALACAPATTFAQAIAPGPAAIFEQYVGAINAGNLEALRALLSEEIARPGYPCPPRVSNKDCVLEWVGGSVIRQHGWITPTSSVAVDGDTVYGGVEIRTELVRQSGGQRLVGIDVLRVRDGRIVEIRFLHNPTDPQTSHYYAWRLPQVDGNPANH